MKREIKFRAKNKRSGEWCIGELHLASKVPHIHPDVLSSIPIDPDTIGQYTGLKDKNGKEIYEGDIVRMKEIGGYGSEYIGVVRYYEKDCRFGIDFTATDKFSKRGLFTEGKIQMNDGHCTITYTHEYEILGNIYDNPELLTEK
jgi:uncharacterized phage protein (TIGR01671 family)